MSKLGFFEVFLPSWCLFSINFWLFLVACFSERLCWVKQGVDTNSPCTSVFLLAGLSRSSRRQAVIQIPGQVALQLCGLPSGKRAATAVREDSCLRISECFCMSAFLLLSMQLSLCRVLPCWSPETYHL